MAASSASHSSLNMRPTGVSSKKRSGWSVVSRSMSPPCTLRLCGGRPPLQEGAGGLGDVAGREAVLLQQVVVGRRFAVDVGDADPRHGRGAVLAEHLGDRAAQSADDVVLLGGDHEAGLLRGLVVTAE